MNCTCCGAEIRENASECRFCGEPTSIQQRYVPRQNPRPPVQETVYDAEPVRADHIYVEHRYQEAASPKNRLVLLLLCIFLGRYGVHRFYQGKVGSGIAYLVTHGWFYIGWIYDIINIACGTVRDGEGRPIRW